MNDFFVIVCGFALAIVTYFLFKRFRPLLAPPQKIRVTTETVQRFDEILKNFIYYKRLSKEGKIQFMEKLIRFLTRVKFFGKEGLSVTEEMMVWLSASATQLSFGMSSQVLDDTRIIHVYPSKFYSPAHKVYLKGGSSKNGIVMVSWPDFKSGYLDHTDNYNLGLHEMAHAIKLNATNGEEVDHALAKLLQQWDAVSQNEFELIRSGNSTFLRNYAGSNKEELFAVCVEYFFESPEAFSKKLPEMFLMLKKLLNQNPLNVTGNYAA